MAHEGLDDYLNELEAPMTGLSEEARRDWREEARQHLLSLTEAYDELGMEPDEALKSALDQFGDAQRIGNSLNRETLRRNRPLVAASLCWSIAAFAWNVLAFGGIIYWSASSPAAGSMFWPQCVLLGLAHVLAGWALGALAKPRLGRWAVTLPFLPYLLFTLNLTWNGISQPLSRESAQELFGGAFGEALIIYLFLGAALLLARGWTLQRRPEETQETPRIA